MRKHFLLLFLMALLPLAGWAAVDVTTAEFTIGSTTLEYVGKETSPAITSATVGGVPITSSDYSLKFYKRTGDVIGDEVAHLINVGDYFVKLYDGAHESNMKLAFSIVKVNMTISLKNVKKTYGAADPIATDFEYTVLDGFVGNDDKNSVVINVSVPAEDAREPGEHVGFYNYSGITATSQNYNIAISAQPQLEIKPATLTVTHDDIVKNFGEANPALNVSDFDIAGWVGYEADGQPDYAAKRAAAITFNSASYTQTETDANCDKNGNFIGGATAGYECTVTGIQLNSADYTLSFAGVKMKIKQVELKDANTFTFTKTEPQGGIIYNGTVQKPTYSIVYKANNYTLTDDDFTVTFGSDPKAAGDYVATVNAVATGNFYTTAAFAKTDFNFTIAQRKLYVQAKPESKPYDGNPFTLTGKTKANFEFNGIADTDAEYTLTANGSVAYVQTLSDAQKKNVGSYKVQPSITEFTLVDGSSDHWETNYKIEALSTATYAITQRPLTITAKDQEIDYGNPAPAFESSATYIHVEQIGGKKIDGTTDVAEGEGAVVAEVTDILAKLEVGLDAEYPNAGEFENAIVVALKDGETLPNYDLNFVAGDYTINGGTYTIIANNITKTYGEDYTLGYTTTGADPAATVEYEVYKAGVLVAGNHPTDAGVYDIKIKQNAAYKPSADYSTITYVDGKLTIKKKALTITPKTVVLNIGATEEVLNQYGTVDYNNGLVKGDKIKYTLKFNTTYGEYVTVTAGALQGPAADYAQGVTIIADAEVEDFDNSNYIINKEADGVTDAPQYGKITVIEENLLQLDRTDNNLVAKISAASTVCEDGVSKYTVSFGTTSRVLTAHQWYAMVLPFDIEVATLSQALGYAVVDVLDEDATDGDAHLTLYMNEIKANQPFIVKVANDKNLNTVSIASRVIEYVAAPEIKDKGGNSFFGTYATVKRDFSETEYYMSGGTFKNNAKNVTIQPLGAYVAASTTAARILIEEPDGSTTVINNITGDQQNFTKDGWYTINGVKLNGIPTEKGIYINNGKKVVVK